MYYDDEAPVCLLGFSGDDSYIKGYDGYISEEGVFYKVRKRGDLDAGYDNFAETFTSMVLKKNIDEEIAKVKQRNKKQCDNSYKNALIHVLGYVNYELSCNNVKVEAPIKSINGHQITIAQIETLGKLIKLNNDKGSDYKSNDDNKSSMVKQLKKYK